jgi:hypothetical protein
MDNSLSTSATFRPDAAEGGDTVRAFFLFFVVEEVFPGTGGWEH